MEDCVELMNASIVDGRPFTDSGLPLLWVSESHQAPYMDGPDSVYENNQKSISFTLKDVFQGFSKWRQKPPSFSINFIVIQSEFLQLEPESHF